MRFSKLYSYQPFHDRFTASRVRQSASRITQCGKLGNYSAAVNLEDAALFLYCLASSQQTRFVFDVLLHENELTNARGTRFVSALSELLGDPEELSKIERVFIGTSVSIIEYKNNHEEVYNQNGGYELGSHEEFSADFLQELADSLGVTEAVEA